MIVIPPDGFFVREDFLRGHLFVPSPYTAIFFTGAQVESVGIRLRNLAAGSASHALREIVMLPAWLLQYFAL